MAFSYQKLAKYTGNLYGITLAADFYEPKAAEEKLDRLDYLIYSMENGC